MRLKKKLSENVKNFAILSANNVLAQIFGFIFLFIVTYLYSPSEFSQLVLFSGLLLWVGPIMCMKFDAALIVSDSKSESLNLFLACVSVSMVMSFIFSLLIVLTIAVD